MDYSDFHQVHPDLESLGAVHPIFHDSDGAPVYEAPYYGLLARVLHLNDVASLHLYNDNPRTKIFRALKDYETWHYHPFVIAQRCRSFDALRALLDIYIADPTLIESLETYLLHIGFSPINQACAFANREMTLWLLHHDPPLATLHDRDTTGQTPLLSAARALGLNLRGGTGTHSPIAARNEKRDQIARTEDFICFLLDQGCSVQDSNIYVNPLFPYDPLVQIQNREKQESNQAPIELKDTVLCAAIPYASYQLVSRLITEGADIHAQQAWFDPNSTIESTKQVTALHIASLFSNLKGMQALIDHRGKIDLAEMVSIPDSTGKLPLHWALMGRRDDRTEVEVRDNQHDITDLTCIVELLLNANPDAVNICDQNGSTVFHYAATFCGGLITGISLIKLLLNGKTNPLPSILNARNYKGVTALEDAIYYHRVRHGTPDRRLLTLLEILLQNGTDGRACNDQGQNLLHILAMNFGDTDPAEVDILDLLLEFVNVNDVDIEGRTSLHFLVQFWNRIIAVRYLISRGADVNMVDHRGNTPLHMVMNGKLIPGLYQTAEFQTITSDRPAAAREEMIQVLIDAGASMDHVNAAGQTPPQLLNELTERTKERWQNFGTRGRTRVACRGAGRGRGL
ncbi:hypothetical protein N7454_007261 [Penicillium verhagenii]|nr:hypothetical protein N7454_007261 [Penicillium verhagenii]